MKYFKPKLFILIQSFYETYTFRLDLLGASSILSGITAFIFLLDLIFTVGMGFRGNLD